MRVYYDRDCDINLIKDKKVAILGYGSQGHAHALNLRDSGAKNLVVALREGSPSTKKAEGEGLKVMGIAEAAAWCDLIMFTMPDELQAATYKKYVHDNLREGAKANVVASKSAPVASAAATKLPARTTARKLLICGWSSIALSRKRGL